MFWNCVVFIVRVFVPVTNRLRDEVLIDIPMCFILRKSGQCGVFQLLFATSILFAIGKGLVTLYATIEQSKDVSCELFAGMHMGISTRPSSLNRFVTGTKTRMMKTTQFQNMKVIVNGFREMFLLRINFHKKKRIVSTMGKTACYICIFLPQIFRESSQLWVKWGIRFDIQLCHEVNNV